MTNESLWTRIDKSLAQSGEKSKVGAAKNRTTDARRFRWVVDAIVPFAMTAAAAVAVLLPTGLTGQARIALFSFALATVLWSTTKLNAAYVALATAVLLVLAGGRPQKALFDALASDVIWLMIGAFILGEAVRKTDLAGRLTAAVLTRASRVGQIFWLLSLVLVLLSFVIPSTSGRAAVVMPVFNSLSRAADNPRISRALSLLIPTIILVSTICTLIGAGSHLVANDLLQQITGSHISFLSWAIYGVPFGIAASGASCWIILRLFLNPAERQTALDIPRRENKQPLSAGEWKTVAVALVMIGFWITESRHGLEIATVTTVGALFLTAPSWGVLTWKEGLKAVSWNLIIFVGAALILGKALIETGAAEWITNNLFELSGIGESDSSFLVLLALAFISLTAHIYMTSHAARAAALVPAMLYIAKSLDYNPAAIVFITTVGMDYCLTFPVSSKALLMFQELDYETFEPGDLLKLSAVLLVVHLILIIAFYYGYWQWIGLAL